MSAHQFILCIFLNAAFILSAFPQYGQVRFQETNDLLELKQFRSGIPMGISDMDGDFKDDLVRLNRGEILTIDLQNVSGLPFLANGIGPVSDVSEWSLTIGDIYNDGRNEIMVSGAYTRAKVLRREGLTMSYRLDQESTNDFYAQGSNFADINNDGWLDLFICDDDGASEIFINDGAGTLIRNNTFIDLTTVPFSDNSGNYASEWSDIDSDGDLDLYISKCRLGVNSPEDPRRINMLFINDSQNQYSEMADIFNLAIGAQSWTSNFEDFDNDGDLDCFMINHDVPSMILENRNNQFFDVTNTALPNSLNFIGYQSIVKDFDNNGFLDIVLAGDFDFILMNQGGLVFEIIENPFGTYEAHSICTGDLNDDGFTDAYISHGVLINASGFVDDAMWLNEGNDNHFIGFHLIGVESNRSAIGTRLELYGEWGVQVRTVRAGESYGIVNSPSPIFGMGNVNVFDSLIVNWPSGVKDKYVDLGVDRKHILTENRCQTEFIKLTDESRIVKCQGDSLILSAPIAGHYEWSNGSKDSSIVIKQDGKYHLTIVNDQGCNFISEPVFVDFDPQDNVKIEILSGNTLGCKAPVTILASSINDPVWNTGDEANTIEVFLPGLYEVSGADFCGRPISDSIHIDFFETPLPEVFPDTIDKGNTATIEALGDSIQWFDEGLVSPIGYGQSFTTPVLYETQSYYARNVVKHSFGILEIGEDSLEGNNIYSLNSVNSGLVFDVYERILLQSVKVYTDSSGVRVLQIKNKEESILFEKAFDIDSGYHKLELNVHLEPGEDYFITTDAETNLQNFGFEGPRLARTRNSTNYPYKVENLIRIKNSSFGPQYYYYFFDWSFEKAPVYCPSEALEVEVIVKDPSSVEEITPDEVLIFPNPVSNILIISDVYRRYKKVSLFDIAGRQVLSEDINSNLELNLTTMETGVYVLLLTTFEGSQKSTRIIVSQ